MHEKSSLSLDFFSTIFINLHDVTFKHTKWLDFLIIIAILSDSYRRQFLSPPVRDLFQRIRTRFFSHLKIDFSLSLWAFNNTRMRKNVSRCLYFERRKKQIFVGLGLNRIESSIVIDIIDSRVGDSELGSVWVAFFVSHAPFGNEFRRNYCHLNPSVCRCESSRKKSSGRSWTMGSPTANLFLSSYPRWFRLSINEERAITSHWISSLLIKLSKSARSQMHS